MPARSRRCSYKNLALGRGFRGGRRRLRRRARLVPFDSSGDSPPEADRGHARPRLIPIVTANTGALLFNLEF